ncbi:MAG: hypothetical protein Q7R35_18560 [Elusimicrobiota bacterium]|nr:hypothetical protein [Elusimicrobiota bacterium]
MSSYNRTKIAGGFSPAILLLLCALLTAAIILGIKFLIKEDSDSLPQSSGQGDIFKSEKGAAAAGRSLGPRSGNPGGDSLDMFKKANPVYEADGSSATAAAEPAMLETVQKTPPAVTGKRRGSKKLQQRTAIPRMQGIKAFGTAAPAKQGLPKGGAGMPDIAEMMKQAQQKQGD